MAEPYLGEIRMASFSVVPKGWALCNGQLLPINQNQALYSILGVTYGGDGRNTFALPNLQGRVPVHISTDGTFNAGQGGGEAAHTLTLQEIPAHTHTVQASTQPGSAVVPGGAFLAAPKEGTALYGTGAPSLQLASASVVATGASQPHNNLPPYLVLNYIIALQGIYPSQS